MSTLKVRGARQHNLRDVDVDLPRNQLVVITGPSGSGKSSLAFDTIYAEGQRRYVESLSAYARQFLEQLPRPDVDSIDGLSPAIAIEQKGLGRSARSTVGTVTEVSDYLRLLFARRGTPHCPDTGDALKAYSVEEIVDRILSYPDGTRLSLLASVTRNGSSGFEADLDHLRREGFVRVRVNGEVLELSELDDVVPALPYNLEVVVDRIVVRKAARARTSDSVELALKVGDGSLLIDLGSNQPPLVMSQDLVSWKTGKKLPPLEPRLFSFNGPHGACSACNGIGTLAVVDEKRVVPDPELTLREGAVAPFGPRGSLRMATEVHAAVEALGIGADIPWKKLAPTKRQALLHGSSTRSKARKKSRYCGIVPRLNGALRNDTLTEPLLDGQDDESLAEEAHLFATEGKCNACNGKRLRPEALSVRLAGRSIADYCELPLLKLRATLEQLEIAQGVDDDVRAVSAPLIRAVVERLEFLEHVGLGYLTLERPVRTLSGGEGQRIRLATQIGASLVGVLYVLDEPSVGLHARDNAQLLSALRKLVANGNSVLVVEHNQDTILHADHLVDMGPGAGRCGGRIVAQGTVEEVSRNPSSVTGPYLTGRKALPKPSSKRWQSSPPMLCVSGARAHNLKNVTLQLPLGRLTVVTGVSGAGKSALIIDTLLNAVRAKLHGFQGEVGPHTSLSGLENIDKVVSIDQGSIGRTPRSNPATYTGLFGHLRDLFANLPEARARGFKAGRFSFNVKGGRCEACAGEGTRRVEMHFLPDIYVECTGCGGKRYNRDTLEIRYRGLSIADVLCLTVDDASAIFEDIPKIEQLLAALRGIGLGYIQLGQSATTLSGGEAQRVKLAAELAKRSTGATLYVLDEPTSGLHCSDIEMLLTALYALRDRGNTVVVIEHNLEVAQCADWLVDIGPGAGDAGGEVVVSGPLDAELLTVTSPTTECLRKLLATR